MPKITFTKENLLERAQLKPTWYLLTVKEIKEETAKDKVSTNYVTTFVVAQGEFTGTPIRHWFSEKAMGRIVDFVNCFTKADAGKDIELNDLVGRQVQGFCGFDPEFKWNKIDDFRPAPGVQKAAVA